MRFMKSMAMVCVHLVEAQFFRINRCIGETLLTQKIESQKCEGIIIANLINLWSSFGRCHCVKAV